MGHVLISYQQGELVQRIVFVDYIPFGELDLTQSTFAAMVKDNGYALNYVPQKPIWL
jgi:hypothetical protein